MKCERFEMLIAQYVEGDLPAGKVQTVERHLAGCPDCREFANGLRLSQSALKTLGHDEVPSASLDRVRAEVMKSVASEPLRRPSHRWQFALAAAVVVAIGAFTFWHAREGGPVMVTSAKHGTAAAPQQARVNSKGGTTPLRRSEIPGKELAKEPPLLPAPSQSHHLMHQVPLQPKAAKRAERGSHAEANSSYAEATIPRKLSPLPLEGSAGGANGSARTAVKVKLLTNDPNIVIYLITD